MKFNYYREQLKKLKADSTGPILIKLFSEEEHVLAGTTRSLAIETKYLTLNEESIPVIIRFLKQELKEMEE